MAVIYDKEIRVEKLALGPWDSNCYVVSCPPGGDTVIIDTPTEAPKILKAVAGLPVRFILITHGHPDHLGALAEVKEKLGVGVAVHAADAGRLPIPADRLLEPGQELSLGSRKLKVIHTPGHTPGSVCCLLGRHLFSGDTLFPNGPGKTTTPQDFSRIVDSVVSQLFILPDDTIVYPGHGEGTVLGKERQLFAAFSSRPWKPDLCGDVVWVP